MATVKGSEFTQCKKKLFFLKKLCIFAFEKHNDKIYEIQRITI